MSKLAHSNQETMDELDRRSAIENGDEDLIPAQTAKHTPEIFVKRSYPVECEQCGEPATKKYTYLLEGNARANPASSAYGEDDCSWCSDHEEFGCDACKTPQVDGYRWCSTFTKNDRFSHMFVTTKYEPIPKLLIELKKMINGNGDGIAARLAVAEAEGR